MCVCLFARTGSWHGRNIIKDWKQGKSERRSFDDWLFIQPWHARGEWWVGREEGKKKLDLITERAAEH